MQSESVGELDFLAAVLPTLTQRPDVLVGPGDDCALLDIGGSMALLAAVDSVIADVHFFGDATPPEEAGAKLLKRNLSDIAAMGGEACWALTAFDQTGFSREWVLRFFAGLEAAAVRYQVALVGGDYAALPARGVAASLTILGRVEPHLAALRSQVRCGDLLYVTGVLGDTLLSGHHLHFEPRLREGRWLVCNGFTRAMMDLSDGLALDARRLGRASGVALELHPARIPCRKDLAAALQDGEDYELLLAVNPQNAARLEREWPFEAPLTRIGQAVPGEPGDLINADTGEKIEGNGYEHVAK